MKARQGLCRFPSLVVVWLKPAPESCSPLKSWVSEMPTLFAAWTKASELAWRFTIFSTCSGPPAPWNSEAPSSWSSERLKRGSTSSQLHPSHPAAAHLS